MGVLKRRSIVWFSGRVWGGRVLVWYLGRGSIFFCFSEFGKVFGEEFDVVVFGVVGLVLVFCYFVVFIIWIIVVLV